VAKGTFVVNKFIANSDNVWLSIEKALEKTNEIEVIFLDGENGNIESLSGDEYEVNGVPSAKI